MNISRVIKESHTWDAPFQNHVKSSNCCTASSNERIQQVNSVYRRDSGELGVIYTFVIALDIVRRSCNLDDLHSTGWSVVFSLNKPRWYTGADLYEMYDKHFK